MNKIDLNDNFENSEKEYKINSIEKERGIFYYLTTTNDSIILSNEKFQSSTIFYRMKHISDYLKELKCFNRKIDFIKIAGYLDVNNPHKIEIKFNVEDSNIYSSTDISIVNFNPETYDLKIKDIYNTNYVDLFGSILLKNSFKHYSLFPEFDHVGEMFFKKFARNNTIMKRLTDNIPLDKLLDIIFL